MIDLIKAAYQAEQEAMYAYRKNDVTFDPIAKAKAINAYKTGVQNETTIKQSETKADVLVDSNQDEVSAVEGVVTTEVEVTEVTKELGVVVEIEAVKTDNETPTENKPSTNSKKRR